LNLGLHQISEPRNPSARAHVEPYFERYLLILLQAQLCHHHWNQKKLAWPASNPYLRFVEMVLLGFVTDIRVDVIHDVNPFLCTDSRFSVDQSEGTMLGPRQWVRAVDRCGSGQGILPIGSYLTN
jgi:hypothetical protein